MLNPFKTYALGIGALLAGPLASQAALINLVGNDAVGTSSYNSGKNWSGGAAPSAGNDYNTAGFFLRTPGDGTTSDVFAGASLTLGTVNLSGGVNGSLLEKFSGGAGSSRTLTINNFTNLSGAMIRSGGTAGALIHIAGNHYTIAGNSIVQADQCIWVLDLPLLGGDSVILTNFANNANDHVALTGTNSGFTGTLVLQAAGTSAWSLELDGLNSLPGNPATLNPRQLTFLAGGQLRDTVGCTYTNSRGGITLAANGTINASVTTLIGVPITDLTNGVHSVSALNATGTGTLILSNANNSYAGGTTISAGVLQLGVANALPGGSMAGDVTVNGTLDLNGYNLTLNGLNGAGVVDTMSGGNPTLTVGANGDNGNFTGTLQNSAGTLSLTKTGAGTETLAGITYTGNTTVTGGTLNLSTAGTLPGTGGNLSAGNGGTLAINALSGNAWPAANVTVATNGTLTLSLPPTATGLVATGNLTWQDNATNTFAFGTLTANPNAPALMVAGTLAAPGSNVVINLTANGLQAGTFTLIKYGTGSLAGVANFQLFPPPGFGATLVNNTANQSLDVQVTSTPNQLAWNGVNGPVWNLTTPNWTNVLAGGITDFQQYTNGNVIAGDAVTFDDTLTNDFINPQPTNVTLAATFYAYPVVVNSTLPYTFSGPGGLAGVTSLVVSNTGSLTLLTSNSFTGGVNLAGGTLVITNDTALGASSGAVTLNGGTLQINGNLTNNRALPMPVASTIGVASNVTASLGGVLSGTGATFNVTGGGTLVLTNRETLTGNVFLHGGTTVLGTGGSLTNANYNDVGQTGNDAATLSLTGNASFSTTADFNVGDIGNSSGTLNVSGSASLVVNAFFIGSANASGSTASGVVNQSGGSVTELSTGIGTFAIGGRFATTGAGVYNMSGGTLTASAGIRVGGTGVGTLNQSGGTIFAQGGVNIARIAGSFGTNNLNGGTLSTYNIASSTSANAVFNFNGGVLQANFAPATPWMSGLSQANILAGGAIIDSSNFSVTISQPLLAGSPNGGLTKKGTGTLTLTGVNTFTGPITNTAGTLALNGASTYTGAVNVNAGTLQIGTASVLQGPTVVNPNATLAIVQTGSASATLSNLTMNGAATLPGATVALSPTLANNPAVALANCGTLTLTGTNTLSLPLANVGTFALIKYTGALAGSGNCTNLALPQGATGYLSNSVANSTLYAVVTSTGPGINWTGTNTTAGKTNLWDINTTANWVLGTAGTTYHQVVVPGDLVNFTDAGNGTVVLNTSVGPTGMVISNNTRNYTFSGTGNLQGPTGLLKSGAGTAVLSLTNNTCTGSTVVSNGTLQAGLAAILSPAANLLVGPAGVFETAGYNQTVAELTGSGVVDNNSGIDAVLTLGSGAGGVWNGTITDQGHGGLAITKIGTGTWVVGGINNLDNGTAFSVENSFAAGTTIITNGGAINVPVVQTWIGNGSTATMIVAGGTLAVTNNVLAVGYSTNANGTLIVNGGTVIHGGGPYAAFGAANNLEVGALGGTGTLIVNGGQVLNSQAVWLGQNASGSGTLWLNGGLLQATVLASYNNPATSVVNFNGGTLQAVTNSADFLQVNSLVLSNGLVLDDNGYNVTVASHALTAGDGFDGGLLKQGAGTVYLDGGNTYTGTTLVTRGTLAGIGSVSGPVVVAPTGTLGAGNAAGIGTFTLGNNLTLQGNTSLRLSKDGGSPASDQLVVNGNVVYGGLLTVTNLTADGTLLAAGDTFTLFNVTGTVAGNFTGIAGSPGVGLAYRFNPATGVLSVVAGVAGTPTSLIPTVTGNTLNLAWPTDHLGWILQTQTNRLTGGLGTKWFDVAGTSSTTNITIGIDPANPDVFFRLREP